MNMVHLINQITPDNFMKFWGLLRPLMKEEITSNEEIEPFVNEKSTSNNGEVMTTGPRPRENKVIENL